MMKKYMVLALFLIGLLVLAGCSGTDSSTDSEQSPSVQVEEGTVLEESPIDFSKITFDVKPEAEEGTGNVLKCNFTNETGFTIDRLELKWTEKKDLGKKERKLWNDTLKAYLEESTKHDPEFDMNNEEDKATYDYLMNYVDTSKPGAHSHVLYIENGSSKGDVVIFYDLESVPIAESTVPGADINALFDMLEPYSMEVLFTDGEGEQQTLKYLFEDGTGLALE